MTNYFIRFCTLDQGVTMLSVSGTTAAWEAYQHMLAVAELCVFASVALLAETPDGRVEVIADSETGL